jgi:hypothetical protein
MFWKEPFGEPEANLFELTGSTSRRSCVSTVDVGSSILRGRMGTPPRRDGGGGGMAPYRTIRPGSVLRGVAGPDAKLGRPVGASPPTRPEGGQLPQPATIVHGWYLFPGLVLNSPLRHHGRKMERSRRLGRRLHHRFGSAICRACGAGGRQPCCVSAIPAADLRAKFTRC